MMHPRFLRAGAVSIGLTSWVVLCITTAHAQESPPAEVVDVVEETLESTLPSTTTVDLTDAPGATTLSDVLETVPGVTVRRSGGPGALAWVSIRGSGLRETVVALDGLPLNPDASAIVDLSTWPTQGLAELVVWRARAPLALSGTSASVIELNTPASMTSPSGGFSGGSWGTWRGWVSGETRSAHAAVPDLMWHGTAFHSDGDYLHYDDNGTVFETADDVTRPRTNNARTQANALLRATWRLPQTSVRLTQSVLHRTEGLAGPINIPADRARLETVRSLLALQSETRAFPWRASTQASWLMRREQYDDRLGEVGVGAQQNTLTMHQARMQQHVTWARPQLLLGGLFSSRVDHVRQLDELTDTRDTQSRWITRVGAELEASPMRSGLLDLRSSAAATTLVAPTQPLLVLPTGFVELGVTMLPWLHAVMGTGWSSRPPQLDELYGDRGTLVGNPDLKPEQRWTSDLGTRARLDLGAHSTLSFDIVGAASWSRDRIVYIQNAQRTSVPTNFGRTRTLSLETSLAVDALDALKLHAQATWTDAQRIDVASPVQLPRIPEVQLASGVNLHWRERIGVGYDFFFSTPSWWDAANLTRSGPRWLHDVTLRARPWQTGPTFELAMTNLANALWTRTPADLAQPQLGDRRAVQSDLFGYPLPGRTFLFTLRWSPSGSS